MLWENWTQLQPDKLSDFPIIYIGCMTGTSADNTADFSAVVFDDAGFPIAYHTVPIHIPSSLQTVLLTLSKADNTSMLRQSGCVAESQFTAFLQSAFTQVIQQLQLTDYPKDNIILSPHGQTLSHNPMAKHYYSDIIVNGAQLAQLCGYKTVTQHRQAALAVSMAAPLAPVLIKKLFYSAEHNVVLLNGGGIANITVLYHDTARAMMGYDTGPGNGPIDAVVQHVIDTQPQAIPQQYRHEIQQCQFDKDGNLAKSGCVISELKHGLLQHDYFKRELTQKSADRTEFGMTQWILPCLTALNIDNVNWIDVITTVTHAVAESIVNAIAAAIPPEENTLPTHVIYYGGIAHNLYLIDLIEQGLAQAGNFTWVTMHELGYDPDFFESLLMAYLGFCADKQIAIDLSYCARENVVDPFAIPGVVAYPTTGDTRRD